MTTRLHSILSYVILLAVAAGCGSTQPRTTTGQGTGEDDSSTDTQGPRSSFPGEPPDSAQPRDVSFPTISRTEAAQQLELNTVEWRQLPVVYLRLVVKSGGEVDPKDKPGLSKLVASMLEEGTRTRSSAELAEEVEFLGADLRTASDEENVYIAMRALADHLDEALEILADVAMSPAFGNEELRKLKKREKDRLSLQENDPEFLAKRELHRALYGEHPYARVDTTKKVVDKVRRLDLMRWHRRWFKPNNAFLVVVGDTDQDRTRELVDRHFGDWKPGKVPQVDYPEPPSRERRQVIVVDRPESVQSVIRIANLAVARGDEQWLPLQVANQVLGGSPASRLFMDLRERRSLTYGAYSHVGERVRTAPFMASASVESAKTGPAAAAFFEHLDAITAEAPPDAELADAQRYLSDSFPLRIDTPGKIASLVADLRVFGLPDDYWDSYRSRIRQVQSQGALEAAEAHIRPEQALVVVVGRAADIAEPLRRWGEVTVIDTQGEVLQSFEAQEPPATGGEATGDAPEEQG